MPFGLEAPSPARAPSAPLAAPAGGEDAAGLRVRLRLAPRSRSGHVGSRSGHVGAGLRLPAEGLELHAGGATCASPACGSSLLRSAPWGWGSPREGARRWLSRPRPRPRPRPRAPLRAGEAWPRLPVSARLAPRLWQQARCFCEHPAEASGGSAGVPGPRACERKFRARALCAFEVPASPRNVSQSGCTSGRPPPRAPSADSISASSNPPWCPFGVRFFLW